MRLQIVICIFCCFSFLGIHAQQKPLVFTVAVENDFLDIGLKGTDRYFTGGFNGVLAWQRSSGGKFFRVLFPSPLEDSASVHSIGVHQKVFTPFDIAKSTPSPGDYPYAAGLYLSMTNTSTVESMRFSSALLVGVTGPAARGEETQKAVHRLINGVEPKGWGFQGNNALLINYNLEFEKAYTVQRCLNAISALRMEAGTYISSFSFSQTIFISRLKTYFLPNTIVEKRTSGKPNPFFYLTPSVKYIFSYGLLQNAITDDTFRMVNFGQREVNPMLNIERFVGSLELGYGIMFKNFGFTYTQVFQSAVLGGAGPHRWGVLSFRYFL